MSVVYRPPPDQGLVVHFCDDALLVVDKPSGLLSVPGRGSDKQDCLASRVAAIYPQAKVVHRLDMSTSGLMIMALSEQAQSQLGRLFQARQVYKRYIAVVDGVPLQREGSIDLPLITDWPKRPRQKIDHQQGKAALTDYRVVQIDRNRRTSRVELTPHTGRSHQLRVHMMALGHPILGDELYANAVQRQASDRLLLHAECLRFAHPVTNQPLQIISPAPF